MSVERKKADKKPVIKVEPKKRAEPKPVPKVEPKKRTEVKVEGKPKTEPKISKAKVETKVEPKKKLEVKPKVETKKKVEEKPKVEAKPVVKEIEKKVLNSFISETTETKPKKSENKYVRLALDAKMDERREFSEKVQKGELKLAFYAIDNDKGYHYYLVIKK